MRVLLVIACLVLMVLAWGRSESLEEDRAHEQAMQEGMAKEARVLEITANKLPEFQREVQTIEERLDLLKLILPAEPELESLDTLLAKVAARTGVDAARVAKSETTIARDLYREIAFDVRVAGRGQDLADFLDGLNRMSRLVQVGLVELRETQGGRYEGRVRLMAFAYGGKS